MLKSRATVETTKASRYLKALCNHFNRRVEASYSDTQGTVAFEIGDCQMEATDNALIIMVQADSDEHFEQVKSVVGDHLIRFAPNEELTINWEDES